MFITIRDDLRVAVANSLFSKNLRPKPKAGLTCTACRFLMLNFISWIKQGYSDEQIGDTGKTLCKTLDIVSPAVCDDVVDEYLPTLLFIYRDQSWLTRFDICGILLGGGTDLDCRAVNETMTDWDVKIAGDKPAFVDRPLVPTNITTTKVIHLADIHADLHYAPGSLAACGNYLCCRASDADDSSNTSISAGPWGDYRDCDMPITAVETILHDAATRHADAEFILMTGDLTHHQIWNYTKEDNLAHYNAVFRILRQEFQNKTIYPSVGNHEPAPCNLFPTREISAINSTYNVSWVYEALANEFSSTLTPDALVTFRQSGYYTQLHKPGFRIISLNTNFCYVLNFFLIHSPQDPEGQLQWFSDTLEQAEKDNELVWIVGHVPPGSDDCWYFWGEKYVALINRYETIIRAQFYGHTHNDELRIFFDMTEEPPRPTGSLSITTSVTPYSYINPGYKVFHTDGIEGQHDGSPTWEIMDYEAWIYNVSRANLDGVDTTPTLFKEYSAKEEYVLPSFRPKDLYNLVVRMAQDNVIFQKYYK